MEEKGFDSLRSDVFCTTRPQSLIGEYFIDCQPGKARRELEPGSKIPVTRTASTIPPDLVNNILRLPYAQRLRIILSELGAGVASRADEINDAIRRGVPALRETDRVLAILADQNQVLSDLVRNGDEVVTALADNKEDIGRFVVEANDTAEASAARSDALAEPFAASPASCASLHPRCRPSGGRRRADPRAAQPQRVLGTADALLQQPRPVRRGLPAGDPQPRRASVVGRDAVRSAGETVSLLRTFSTNAPELAKNLAIVLEWLDDRQRSRGRPPQPGRQGVHRPRGAAAVHLRPGPGDQRLRPERLRRGFP